LASLETVIGRTFVALQLTESISSLDSNPGYFNQNFKPRRDGRVVSSREPNDGIIRSEKRQEGSSTSLPATFLTKRARRPRFFPSDFDLATRVQTISETKIGRKTERNKELWRKDALKVAVQPVPPKRQGHRSDHPQSSLPGIGAIRLHRATVPARARKQPKNCKTGTSAVDLSVEDSTNCCPVANLGDWRISVDAGLTPHQRACVRVVYHPFSTILKSPILPVLIQGCNTIKATPSNERKRGRTKPVGLFNVLLLATFTRFCSWTTLIHRSVQFSATANTRPYIHRLQEPRENLSI